jgi:7-cyano-7-deazaguanine synthase in queuosine biosynthesis
VVEPGLLMATGGIDSTVLAHLLARAGLLRGLVFVNYGQASAARQSSLVAKLATQLAVPLEGVTLPWPENLRGSGQLFQENPKLQYKLEEPYELLKAGPAVYQSYLEADYNVLEGRNLVLLSMGCAVAIKQRVGVLYTGFQYDTEDWRLIDAGRLNEGDAGPRFLRSFNGATAAAFTKPVRVSAPFFESRWNKRQIIDVGRSLGVNFGDTHSCEYYPCCGKCRPCVLVKGLLERRSVFR